MTDSGSKIVIIGAGPTGLGAAWRLCELGYDAWELLEAEDHPGGLASSFVDENGFTWDIGGHVAFSHYEYFDALLDGLLGDAWVEHVREAWIWIRDRFIPYPLQNNIWRLPAEDLAACLDGLLDVYRRAETIKPASFAEWIEQVFGRGLAEVFMLPYNAKVWAYHPSEMGVQWVGERVAAPDLRQILKNVAYRRDDVGWGPNSTFRFPLHGGTGRIWRSLAARLPSDRVHYNTSVVGVDCQAKVLRLADGQMMHYDVLISTMPVNELIRIASDDLGLRALAGQLRYSSSHVVGVGLVGQVSEDLSTRCWMYFPEPDIPFYRTTVFSNYSPNNVPDSKQHWSLMAEVSESPSKPVDGERIADRTVDAMRITGLIPTDATVASLWHKRVEHGYPTPCLARDELLAKIEPRLRAEGIYSRGRFGAWKYEVANMDHSVMQGVEAVDHILSGTEETTHTSPETVNAGKTVGLRPKPRLT